MHIIDAGGASVIIRKGKKRSVAAREGREGGGRNNSADTKVSRRGGEGGSSSQPVVKVDCPLQPVEDQGAADVHAAAHGDPMLEQALGRRRGPWQEAHAGARFLSETGPLGTHAGTVCS